MDVIIMDDRIVRVKEKKNNNNDYISKYNYMNNYTNNYKNNYTNESSSVDNDSNSSSIEKEQDLSTSHSSQNKTFSDNIDLLESNNINELYKKMQESADKMVEHYKNSNKFNELSTMILYYSSESFNNF